jgi:Protein of unknown function (DUF2637)
MSDFRNSHDFRTAGYHGVLRTGALMIMVTGVVLLALAAFLLSYRSVHEIAVLVGFHRGLAGLYPLILDAIVVLACVSVLAFRDAELWLRGCTWLLILVVFAALAAMNAIRAEHISLPQRPTAVAAAILPWVLLLLGFGLLLSLLRQRRADRHTTPLSDLGKRNAAVRGAVGRESADETFPAAGFFPWDAEPTTQDPEPESSIPGRSAVRSPAAVPETSVAVPDSLDAWPDGPDVRIIPAPPHEEGADGEPGTFDKDLRPP